MSYDSLAAILRYPEGDYHRAVLAASEAFPEELSDFADFATEATPIELEDLYIRTFDIHAICFLEVGYVLFGEDYKRGHLLVKLHEVLNEFGIDPRGELADHLPTLLDLLPKLRAARPEEAGALVEKLILPALVKMLDGFADKGNVFAGPLQAVRSILRRDYPECAEAADKAPRNIINLPAYRNNEMMGDAHDV